MLIIYLVLCIGLIGLDQGIKYLTVATIPLGQTREFIPGLLSFTNIRNTGAAWSVLEGKMWFFYTITLIVIVVIPYLIVKNKKGNKWFLIGLTLVLAGAVGNFIDRVRLGYVVDMLQTDFINFPIFNIADATLVIGVICILIYLILEEKAAKDGKDGTN